MEHHYPAWETVLQIDFLMVGVAVAATTFLAWQRRPLAQARAQVGALIILFGLWVHASLFVVDLFAIIFLPDQVGVEGAMVFIHRLHDEYSWYVNAGAAVLIFTGLAITIRRLTEQSRAALREREAALRSEQRLRTVLESEPECVKILDRDGTLLDMNPAGLAMVEAAQLDEVCGLSVFALVDPKYHQAYRQTIDDVFAGKQTQLQFEIEGLNGTRRWMDQVAAPLIAQDGSSDIREVLAVTRDITAQVAAMGELSVEKQKAEAANDAKTRFLANMSHEIRTPLNGVLGMAQVLAREDLGTPANEYVATILDSGEALLAVVNDVLDVAKIEAQRLELVPQEAALRDCLSRTVDLWQPLAEKKGLALSIEVDDDVPGTLVFDDVRVRQCVSNLISNAVKFTDSGQIAITVRAEPAVTPQDGVTDASLVSIAVRDSGIGISEADQIRLFDAFEQADATDTRAHGGTGLGLAIARKLARLMGGDITVASRLGDGATFTLTFRAEMPEPFDSQNTAELLAVQG